MINIKFRLNSSTTLSEHDIYLIRKDLQQAVNDNSNELPTNSNELIDIFGISTDVANTISENAWYDFHKQLINYNYEKSIQNARKPLKTNKYGKTRRLELNSSHTHRVEGFYKGDYVKLTRENDQIYRVAAFAKDANKNSTLLIIPLFEKTSLSTPQYLSVYSEELILIKKSPLRFFIKSKDLYNKTRNEYGWKVESVSVSEWGMNCDLITCIHYNHKSLKTFSIMELVPVDERICWNCKSSVSEISNIDCNECRWFVCNCRPDGACGCQHLDFKSIDNKSKYTK